MGICLALTEVQGGRFGGLVRIGFDARAIRYRGIGTYSRNLLSHFAVSDIQFVVFCQDEEKDAIPLSDSFTLVSANMNPLASHGRAPFRNLVEKSGVDLLHVPSPWAPTPLSVPLVSTVHDVTPLLYPRSLPQILRLRYKRQLGRTLQEARRVITVSQISFSALSAYAGVDAAKVRVIHNGVSERFRPQTAPETLLAVRRRYGLPERFVFWVGDFRPEKNLAFLIQGWARLHKKLPDPLPLVLAGAQTGDFPKVKKEVDRHGIEGSVLFPGFIRDDDLPALYSAATVFVFPSLYEGFGLPPLEAMACGTPCVVSNSSSLPEVTGSAALLFNPTSLDDFESCMLRVLTEPELYERLRQDGLRQSTLFPWSKAAGETLEVYRAVWDEARASAPHG
jgi:glycosyltransferase involved in cell wall biosynthesis